MESTPNKIALFVGSDITAQLVLNKIIPDLISSSYEPVIFLPKHRPNPKANLPELREAAFVERTLTNEVVYPFLESHPFQGSGKNTSPEQLARKYGLQLEYVDNVNNPAFVEKIKADAAIKVGLSVRCFQIFGDDIIQAFREKEQGNGIFLNLHPGVLPKYRGVLSTVRAIAAGEKEYGWTLHHIDRGIDTGDILWVTAKKTDLSKTGTLSQIDVASIGADSIRRALNEIEQGNVLKGYPQNSRGSKYYTYPTEKELAAWKNKGIKVSDVNEIKGVLVDKFSDANTQHGRMLGAEISKAIDAWKVQNNYPASVPPEPRAVIKSSTRLLGGTSGLAFGT